MSVLKIEIFATSNYEPAFGVSMMTIYNYKGKMIEWS